MLRIPTMVLVTICLLGQAVPADDPVCVRIDCDDVLSRRPEGLRYGVCLNYLVDSDHYDDQRPVAIRDSLRKLQVKAIRWNEGEIGDKMIWSIPPFQRPDVHATHLRTPGTVHYNSRVDEAGKMERPMELDEAISVARDLGIELFIIVGIDAVWVDEPAVRGADTEGRVDSLGQVHKGMSEFSWSVPGKSAREMILDGTTALAEYLHQAAPDVHVVLEIGNENYLGDASWKPECYARVANDLNQRIKHANPKIHTGVQLAHQFAWTSVSEDGRPWNEVVLEEIDLSRVDYFVVHQYGFKEMLNLESAVAALSSLPENHRERIELAVTELGTWHLPGSKDRWSPNDLRRSLYQFRWLGMIQEKGRGKVRTPLFWTSRWLDALKHGSYEKSFHALNLDGELTPSGMAIRIWNRFVYESLVRTTVPEDASDLYCFASRSTEDPRQMTVWVVNNSQAARSVQLTLDGFSGERVEAMYRYGGTGPDDLAPAMEPISPISITRESGSLRATCPLTPYSLNVIQLAGP